MEQARSGDGGGRSGIGATAATTWMTTAVGCAVSQSQPNKNAPSVKEGARWRRRSRGLVPIVPRAEVAHLTLRILTIHAVAFLQFAREDFRLAFELVDLVVGQLAPL